LILAHVEVKVTQNNIPSFNFVTNMGHKCFFDHVNLQSQAFYIDIKNLKEFIDIILEDNGSGYASGDIVQLIVQIKN
jgi:hypothetical protein